MKTKLKCDKNDDKRNALKMDIIMCVYMCVRVSAFVLQIVKKKITKLDIS